MKKKPISLEDVAKQLSSLQQTVNQIALTIQQPEAIEELKKQTKRSQDQHIQDLADEIQRRF